jgi:beta-lactamase regulating signal transducer with metallopeptidase domain
MTVAELLNSLLVVNIVGGAAVLAVLALRGPVRKLAGARVAYLIWLVVPVAIAASFLPARVVVMPAPVVAPAVAVAAPAAVLLDPAPVSTAAPAAPVVMQTPDEAGWSGWTESVDWMLVLAVAWALGTVGVLTYLAATQYAAVRALGPLTRVSATTFRAARSALGPAVVGVLSPRIVLPADFEENFDEAERKVVLAHEEAHLRGRHTAVKALAHVAVGVCWFNPLAWIAARGVAMDQELACDEAVAQRHPKERRIYATVLLKTQSGLRAPLGCYWPVSSANALKTRISRLGASSRPPVQRAVGVSALALLAVAAGCTAWSAKPPEERAASGEAPGFFAANPETGPVLADVSDYVIIRGKLIRSTPDEIWVQAAEVSRQFGKANASTQVWRMSMEALTRNEPKERPANIAPENWKNGGRPPENGREFYVQGYAMANKACAPECRGVATTISTGSPGAWQSATAPADQASSRGPVQSPRLVAGDPEPQTVKVPAGYDAADTIYVLGKVERIEFGATTYVVFLRADMYAPDPYQTKQLNTQLWQLSPTNYFGDAENRKEIEASMMGKRIDVAGYRATDKSCEPACRIYTREIFPQGRDQKFEAGFGGLRGQFILDDIVDRSKPVTLKGTVIRFDTAEESGSPHGVLWIESTSVEPASTQGSAKGTIWRVAGFPKNVIEANFWVNREVTINGFSPKAKACRDGAFNAPIGDCFMIGKQIM